MTVAVIGGKGGVGTTTVAYCLGAALDAVVVDADLGVADLPTSRGPDLHDVLAGRATPIEAVREGGPVDILPCGRRLRGTRGCDLRRLTEVIETVVAEYGEAVVDCPAGMGADTGLSLLAADRAVVVATPEQAALADALRVRALAAELDAGLCGVVLNRVDGEPRPTAATVERAFGAPVVTLTEQEPVGSALHTECPPHTPAIDEVASLVQSSRRA